MAVDYIGFIAAALIAIGGAIGYFKAGKLSKWFNNIFNT